MNLFSSLSYTYDLQFTLFQDLTSIHGHIKYEGDIQKKLYGKNKLLAKSHLAFSQ